MQHINFRNILIAVLVLFLFTPVLHTNVRSHASVSGAPSAELTPLAYLPLVRKDGTPQPVPSATLTSVATPSETATRTPTTTPSPTITSSPTTTPSPTVTPCASVSGTVAMDTTWLRNCTYIMVGNVTVPEGVTLTIEPGVSVLAAGYYSLQIAGVLHAEGTITERIIFTRQNPNVLWRGIQFISGTGNQTTSTLSYATIRGADYAIDVTGGKNIPSVSHSIIENNGYGVYSASGYSTIPMSISYSRIAGNSTGIWLRITGGGSLSVTYNTITNNSIGIDGVYSFTSFQVHNNNLYGNSSYNIKGANVIPGTGEVTIDATNNWWGTSDAAEIATTIYDCNDDLEVGCVTYQPFATSPITGTP